MNFQIQASSLTRQNQNLFYCHDGSSIALEFVCNGRMECQTGEDEYNCGSSYNTVSGNAPTVIQETSNPVNLKPLIWSTDFKQFSDCFSMTIREFWSNSITRSARLALHSMKSKITVKRYLLIIIITVKNLKGIRKGVTKYGRKTHTKVPCWSLENCILF